MTLLEPIIAQVVVMISLADWISLVVLELLAPVLGLEPALSW